MEEKENFYCKVRSPEGRENYLLVSYTTDKAEAVFPAELIALSKSKTECAVILFNSAHYETNVPFDIAVSRLFKEDRFQTRRSM